LEQEDLRVPLGLHIFFIILLAAIYPFLFVTILVSFFALYVFLPAAVIYLIVGTGFAISNRRKGYDLALREDYSVQNEDVIYFKTRWQRHTFSLNIILVITAVLGVTAYGFHWFVPHDWYVLVPLGALATTVFCSIFMAIANVPFVYHKAVIADEEYAMKNHLEAHRLIRANRIWSWITWYGWIAVAIVLGYALAHS
jgi:hypothetical protein